MPELRLCFLLSPTTFALFGSIVHALEENIHDKLTTTQVVKELLFYYLEACKLNE